jgi:hypothetical protein
MANFTDMDTFAPTAFGATPYIEPMDNLLFGPDPTILNATDPPPVSMITIKPETSGPISTAASFFFQPYDAPSIGEEAKLSYDVYFEPEFKFGKGVQSGVLPGLFGGPINEFGPSAEDPQLCIPGSDIGDGADDGGDVCFGVRPLWGKGGEGRVHINAPLDAQPCQVLETASIRKNGFELGIGTWMFEANKWYAIEIYIKLNSFDPWGAPVDDGKLQVKVANLERLAVSDLVWRTSPNVTIDAVHFASYWMKRPIDAEQHVLFRNFGVETASVPAYPPPPPFPPPPPPRPLTEEEEVALRRKKKAERLAKLAAEAPGPADDFGGKEET